MTVRVVEAETEMPPSARYRGKLGQLHGPLAVCLVAIVALSVVPLGSNRPFFWAFWSSVLGIAALVYVIGLAWMRQDFYTSVRSMPAICALYGVICLTLLVQLLPLGSLYWGAGLATTADILLHPPFISTTPGDTLLMLVRWLGYGLMFFLSVQVAGNAIRRMRMLQGLALVIVAHAVLAILSYYQWGNTILGAEKWAYLDSITGTFVNRNSFASFMALGLTMTIALAMNALETRRGVHLLTAICTYGVYILFLVGALLGSNSRMGLVVGLLGSMTVIACHLAGQRQGARRVALIAVFAVVVVCMAGFTYQTGVWLRFLELESSGTVRLELYTQVLDMIQHAPILGFGGGSFARAFQLFHQPPVNVELVWDRAHNSYLAMWSELGVVAGSIPLAIVALICVSCLRAFRRSVSIDPALTIWIGGTVVAGVHSLVDFSFEMYAMALTFTMLSALAMAAAIGRLRQA